MQNTKLLLSKICDPRVRTILPAIRCRVWHLLRNRWSTPCCLSSAAMSVTTFEGPPLSHEPPRNLTLPQFMLDSSHPLRPVRSTENPWLIDDTTGLSYNFEVTRTRVYGLANSLAARWDLGDNNVVCTFTPNDVGKLFLCYKSIASSSSIDYPIAMWAIHRLGAAVT